VKSIDAAGAVFAGHVFRDATLLAQALTHRSAGARHNERLEFLGDALIGMIVAEALYIRWPKADEGVLTRARAELVRESSLAQTARDLDLGARITLGPGELKSGGHRRDSILSDTLEAVVGAIYLDGGFDACRDAVLPWFERTIMELPAGRIDKDPKTRLQEWLQARQRPLPVYELLAETGDEHAKLFRVRCMLVEPLLLSGEGEGSSRRVAEQAAAAAVIAQLGSAG
jgi:ribonuclease-3